MTSLYLILSVVLGVLLVEFTNLGKRSQKWFLTFSGAFLFAITILHIVPEAFEHHLKYTGLFLTLGFLIQYLLDFASGGIEHGHYHSHSKEKIPWGLLIGLYVHAYIEGIPTAMHHHDHGELLLQAILLHKVPISMVLYVFLKQATDSKVKQFLALIFFAVCAPLGNLTGSYVPFISEHSPYLLALTAGIFLHVSTSIIFESGADHKLNWYKFIAVIFGFGLAFLSITTF